MVYYMKNNKILNRCQKILLVIFLILPAIFLLLTQYFNARMDEVILAKAIEQSGIKQLIYSFLLIFLGYLFACICWGATRYGLIHSRNLFESGAKRYLIYKLFRIDPTCVDEYGQDKLLLNYQSDSNTWVNLVTEDTYEIVYSFIMGIGIFAFIALRNLFLGIVILVLVLIVLLSNIYYVALFARIEREKRKASENSTGLFLQMLRAKDVIRALNIKAAVAKEFEERTSDQYQANMKDFKAQLHKSLAVDWFVYACATLILPLACVFVSMGKIEFTDVVFISQLAGNVIFYTRTLGTSIISYQRKKVVLKEMFDLFEKPEEETTEEGRNLLSGIKREEEELLVFKEVSVTYQDGFQTEPVSFSCKKGSITSLVGPSGCGKSSLVGALLGFLPYSGEIYIGGQKLTKQMYPDVRNLFGYVSERCEMDMNTVKDNLCFGRQDITEETLIQYLQEFHLESLLPNEVREKEVIPSDEWKKALEKECGMNGEYLSGGQKQRISLIRAFLCNAPILILDEPTSALDLEAEQQEMMQLKKLSQQGKTILIISHRETSIEVGDAIVKLKVSGSRHI